MRRISPALDGFEIITSTGKEAYAARFSAEEIAEKTRNPTGNGTFQERHRTEPPGARDEVHKVRLSHIFPGSR